MSAKGSVLKRVRQSLKNKARNKHYKSILSTVSKKVKNATKKDSEELYNLAAKTIDKIASKGVIHKNKAANRKSRLKKFINQL